MKKIFLLLLFTTIYSCSKKEPFKNNTYYNQAKEYLRTNTTDSAFYYFNIAKNEYLKRNDSIGTAKSLVNMAIIQTNNGDFFGGIETSLEANKFLKQDNDSIVRSTLAANYNNIAISSHFLKNYDSALDYHFKALKYSNDNRNKLIYYNNIGDILITLGKFKSAKIYLKKAIQTKDLENYSRALNNLAKARYLDEPQYNPLPEFYKALELRQKENYGPGQNSSFETLSTYYLNKDKILSLNFAKKMLEVATNNKSLDDQILALQRIITLDSKNYLTNFQKFNQLNDSVQTTRNKAKNQFAFVRYDVEKMQRDKAENEVDILKRNIGLGILSIILIGSYFWYRKRKKRLEQEKELEVKNTQLKMSKKVHDVVANGIYQVMTKIENQENFDKEKALDELEFVYEKSRDISYEKTDPENEIKDWKEKISNLIASFKNEKTETYTVGNESDIWSGISTPTFEDLYQVIRELLVNMKKHSQASRVVFKFERINNLIKIQYSDDGIGIPGDMVYKNGLTNTGTRIDAIRGEIIFDNKSEKGLKVNISFPVS